MFFIIKTNTFIRSNEDYAKKCISFGAYVTTTYKNRNIVQKALRHIVCFLKKAEDTFQSGNDRWDINVTCNMTFDIITLIVANADADLA